MTRADAIHLVQPRIDSVHLPPYSPRNVSIVGRHQVTVDRSISTLPCVSFIIVLGSDREVEVAEIVVEVCDAGLRFQAADGMTKIDVTVAGGEEIDESRIRVWVTSIWIRVRAAWPNVLIIS